MKRAIGVREESGTRACLGKRKTVRGEMDLNGGRVGLHFLLQALLQMIGRYVQIIIHL
jgi:hypothetical protein